MPQNGWGHLASILSAAENRFITDHIGGGYAWIGGHDLHGEGHWKWTDGWRFRYSNWRRGEPNNAHGVEDCAHWMGGHGEWNDIGCSAKMCYICKTLA